MAIRKLKGVVLRLYYVPGSLNALALDEEWQIRDVYLKRVVLTAGEGTLCGAVTIDETYDDNGGQGLWFQNWQAAIIFLNETFNVENGLKGAWNISNDGLFINYQNMEKFVSGQLTVDQGVFGGELGDEFH